MRQTHLACGGTLLLSSAVIAPAAATTPRTYYVSPGGSNGNAGTVATKPLKTIQYAAGLTNPGDTVLVMNGTYTNDAPGDNILFVSRSGTAAAPITFKAYPGQHPLLRYGNSWAAIRVSANFIVLDGFQIVGNAAGITSRYAAAQAHNLLNPLTNGDGIDVDQPSENVTPHNVTIQNIIIHDVSGGGIAVDYADYVTIRNNLIFNTSNWSPYGDSAISIYEPHDVDTNTVKIIDNILSAPGGKIITSNNENANTVTEDYNVLWNFGGPLLRPVNPGPHDMLADPLLTYPMAGDFALRPGSPARHSAEPISLRRINVPLSTTLVTSTDRGAE